MTVNIFYHCWAVRKLGARLVYIYREMYIFIMFKCVKSLFFIFAEPFYEYVAFSVENCAKLSKTQMYSEEGKHSYSIWAKLSKPHTWLFQNMASLHY